MLFGVGETGVPAVQKARWPQPRREFLRSPEPLAHAHPLLHVRNSLDTLPLPSNRVCLKRGFPFIELLARKLVAFSIRASMFECRLVCRASAISDHLADDQARPCRKYSAGARTIVERR
jgi:hypothetical protein